MTTWRQLTIRGNIIQKNFREAIIKVNDGILTSQYKVTYYRSHCVPTFQQWLPIADCFRGSKPAVPRPVAHCCGRGSAQCAVVSRLSSSTLEYCRPVGWGGVGASEQITVLYNLLHTLYVVDRASLNDHKFRAS